MTGMPLHVEAPCIMGTMAEVIKIALVDVGLALKRDIAIGISSHGQTNDPFGNISQKKEHKQHLTLLCSVDALVVNHLIAQINPMMHKKHAHQVDGRETMERQY